MGLYPIEQAVLKRWKSLKRLHAFLSREFERMNADCFEGQLSRPQLKLGRTWLTRSYPDGTQPAAHYKEPCQGRRATITLYPVALSSQRTVRAALLHEMIHHWEATAEELEESAYPQALDKLIIKRFANPAREKQWRKQHPSSFIEKAAALADRLKVPVEELLFQAQS